VYDIQNALSDVEELEEIYESGRQAGRERLFRKVRCQPLEKAAVLYAHRRPLIIGLLVSLGYPVGSGKRDAAADAYMRSTILSRTGSERIAAFCVLFFVIVLGQAVMIRFSFILRQCGNPFVIRNPKSGIRQTPESIFSYYDKTRSDGSWHGCVRYRTAQRNHRLGSHGHRLGVCTLFFITGAMFLLD
jgi:hypothetical protein